MFSNESFSIFYKNSSLQKNAVACSYKHSEPGKHGRTDIFYTADTFFCYFFLIYFGRIKYIYPKWDTFECGNRNWNYALFVLYRKPTFTEIQIPIRRGKGDFAVNQITDVDLW